jgi:hypothetical protein
MPDWPDWWEWELVLSDHLLLRMVQRRFTEVELRDMMERALGVEPSREYGRWVLSVRRGGKSWEVVVEPDLDKGVVKVLTAYEVG